MIKRILILACVVLLLAGCADTSDLVSGAQDLKDAGTSLDSGLTAEQSSQLLEHAQQWQDVSGTSQLAQEFKDDHASADQLFDSAAGTVSNPSIKYANEIACAAIDYDNQYGSLPNPDDPSQVGAAAAEVGLGYIPAYELQGVDDNLSSILNREGDDYLHTLGLICGISKLSDYADG